MLHRTSLEAERDIDETRDLIPELTSGDFAEAAPIWRVPAHRLRMRAIAALMAADAIVIIFSFGIANFVRVGPTNSAATLFAVVVLGLYFVVAGNQHAFANEALRSSFTAIRLGLRSLGFAIAAAIFAVFFTKTSGAFPRLTIGIGAVIAIFLMFLLRYWIVGHLDLVIGGSPFRTLMIVDGDVEVPEGRFSYVVQTDDILDPDLNDPKLYFRIAELLKGADRVLVVCEPERRIAWAGALRGANVQGEIYMPELASLTPSGMGDNHAEPSLIVATGPLNMVDRATKRAFDLAFASAALIAISPVLILVAILIKIDSPGPVLFRQERFGRANEMFSILKFRSMYSDRSDRHGSRSTARDDDRITRVGRFIRRTSIDELPQLLNVLRGDMSIVGPRPHAAASRAEDKLFWEVDRRYWERHAAKPGLTGLAQIRGYRGATDLEIDLRNRLASDLEYLRGWSIWRDVKIVILTVRVILHANAF